MCTIKMRGTLLCCCKAFFLWKFNKERQHVQISNVIDKWTFPHRMEIRQTKWTLVHRLLHTEQYTAVDEDPTAELFLLKAFQILWIEFDHASINDLSSFHFVLYRMEVFVINYKNCAYIYIYMYESSQIYWAIFYMWIFRSADWFYLNKNIERVIINDCE